MKLVKKCSHATNGWSCNTKKNQETGLYEPCVFSEWTAWEKQCKGKNRKETIKFLQDTIMSLGLKMGQCRKRIEKTWCNHKKTEIEIKEIKQQVQKEIDRINSEIKSLLRSSHHSKNHLIKLSSSPNNS